MKTVKTFLPQFFAFLLLPAIAWSSEPNHDNSSESNQANQRTRRIEIHRSDSSFINIEVQNPAAQRLLRPIVTEIAKAERLRNEIKELQDELATLSGEENSERIDRLTELISLQERILEITELEIVDRAKQHGQNALSRINTAQVSTQWQPGPEVKVLISNLEELESIASFESLETWFDDLNGVQIYRHRARRERSDNQSYENQLATIQQRRRGSETSRERLQRLTIEWNFHRQRMARLEDEMRLFVESDEEFQRLFPGMSPPQNNDDDPFAPQWWNQMSPEERSMHPYLDPGPFPNDGPPNQPNPPDMPGMNRD